MANGITYIIGNGLDLSLGLDTSYKHFYDYVRDHDLHPKNNIYKAIQNDPETWSDFEIELGKYTRYLQDVPAPEQKKAAIKFHEELEEVIEDLADYLETQDKPSGKSIDSVHFTRESFYEELPPGQRIKIEPYAVSNPHTIHFVSLNYTNTLERVLPGRNTLQTALNARIGGVHHLHGDLSENVTLGVSDESQLYADMPAQERDDLIKPRLIGSMNDDRLEAFERIMDNSRVLVLFGTSIGDSDRYLWDIVIEWLAFDQSRYIIIHKHDGSYTEKTKRIPRRQKLFISAVQDKLLDYSELDEEDTTDLRSRIFVVHNTRRLFAPK